jgi:hypothetical protein
MRNFNDFNKLVKESLEQHARRKGYNNEGADGDNMLYQFTKHIGASGGHSMGEIIYKATEYMKEAREVLLIKIAAWAFLEWKYFKGNKDFVTSYSGGGFQECWCRSSGAYVPKWSYHTKRECHS